MKAKNLIPRIAHAFFKWYCKPEKYEELHGDLEEFFHERVEEKGLKKARILYFWDVVRCFQPYAWKNTLGLSNSSLAMIRNFYFTTVRNLLKNKSYFLINVSGLAIGIASFAFISLYIINELSYDRFNENHENTYRASSRAIIRGQASNSAATAAPLAGVMLDRFPEVESATRILEVDEQLIGKGDRKINEEGILFADEWFFDVFDFKLSSGNPKTALAEPRSMILSESYANKYFGDMDPIGQQITVDEDSIFYTITGIVENLPANSHIQFDMLGSLSSKSANKTTRWIGTNVHTYVVLNPSTDRQDFQAKMKAIFYDFMAPEIEYYTGLAIEDWEEAGNSVGFELTPITDIHLRSISRDELEPTGNLTYIYIYGIIGITILFIAIFNFVNLATAHSVTRAKEVGVRKVIGSTKRALISQFILESVIISFLATILSVVMILSFKPAFIDLVGKNLAFDLTSGYTGWLSMAGLSIFIGVLAGFYPSFVLSRYKPVQVLKGTFSSAGKTGWLRNLLVTIQFTASIVIIIGTLVVYNQIDFMLSKNLGFDKEQTMIIKRPDWVSKNLEPLKKELLDNPGISAVANSETIPGKNYDIRSYRRVDDPETFLFLNNQVSYDYKDLMGFDLVAGRFFSKDFASDSNAVVLNESAARAFGFEDPIGKQLTSAFKSGTLTIIGVIKDYNVESLHKSVASVSLELSPNIVDNYLSLKIVNAQSARETVEYIEDAWARHSNGKPFQYFFLDQEYETLYRSETSTGEILFVFATLSVFIACMGLIGLITYTASIRRKEIGIRKVLGASTATLIRLLSSQVMRLIVIATLVSWPLAYLATDYWLQNFIDRVSFNPWMYLVSTFAVLVVVGVAIGYQTIKTSLSDPVESLREE
ncbi:MAG: ABC transporter permease [Cyclobacteriaceae bacterium]